MHRRLAAIIQRQHRSMADLERFIDESLQTRHFDALFSLNHANDDLDIVLLKAIQPEWLVGRIDLSVGANFGVAVARRPFGNVGVKAFSVLHHRARATADRPVACSFAYQLAAQFIPCLRLAPALAIGTILRPEPRKEQPQEMINLGHGRDGAFAAAARGPLLDADRRRNAR